MERLLTTQDFIKSYAQTFGLDTPCVCLDPSYDKALPFPDLTIEQISFLMPFISIEAFSQTLLTKKGEMIKNVDNDLKKQLHCK